MNLFDKRTFGFAYVFLLFIGTSFSQTPLKPRPSPLDLAKVVYGNTYVKITYSRPHKNGRKVFGELVPYGKIWRLGANETTEITTNKEIKINGEKLEAGTYSMFAIPEKDKWTIIINKEVGQWGAYRYQKKKDMMRFDVPVIQSDTIYEPFTMEFKRVGKDFSLLMIWDRTKVEIPVKL